MALIRYLPFAGIVLLFIISLGFWHTNNWWVVSAVIAGALSIVGIVDLLQTRKALRANYPVIVHFRYLFEAIRPQLRQYLFESDEDKVPFSRNQRELVYQRAQKLPETRAFGTQRNVYAEQYEWINHSVAPTTLNDEHFRVVIGGEQCKHPYSASILNISAMSFGSLSPNAIRALNRGAKLGNFYHDTGEGSISRYHQEYDGDLVWELGSGYFGARNADGSFSPERFAQRAKLEQVKMIEIKLSQGAKPGHGGMLPGSKVSAEIAEARGIEIGQDCISPPKHSAFSTPIELLNFVQQLRELSGGKPVGFKLAIGHPWEWFAIAKAMLKTGILPDFIVVDGAEGGTGAAPVEFADHIGTPMREALRLVHNTLVGINVRQQVKIGAAGKIISAYDMARTIALGADWCNSARGFMFALSCVQSLACHTDHCPTGIATQEKSRWKNLDSQNKAVRVFNYHHQTVKALKEVIEAAGLKHPRDLGPEHIIHRTSSVSARSMEVIHHQLTPGSLLDEDNLPDHILFQKFWTHACPDTFEYCLGDA
ncbi:FMN-binding glutamate synthase family protein [Pseudomonas sp. F1_0610]|uniref:FMN-binding glutamate synthase family protein n=1 Tax=Pseudomonas sp. F1_0610 TaxID=3114284 RepID=UPI0039C424C0